MPNAYVAGTNTPLGTEFDDGVRYGPVLERNTLGGIDAVTGLPVITTGTIPGNYDQWGPGLLASSKNTYNIIPRGPGAAGNVVSSIANPAMGYLTLSGDNYVATQYNASTSVPATQLMNAANIPALQLDWPRALSVTVGVANFTAGNLTIFGFDYFGYPLQESVQISGQQTYQMNKAFYVITGAYLNAATGAGSTLTIQTTDVLGLPYRVKSAGDIDSIRWGNSSDLGTSQSMTGYTIADMGVNVIAGGGTFTVLTPYVQANSVIQLTYATNGTDVLPLKATTASIVAGTSFIVTGDAAATFAWTVLNPPATQGLSVAMVLGSVTIPSAAVRSDSVIHLTMGTFGTATGAWTVSKILPGVSFTVTSTAATETSTVKWAIMPSNFVSGVSAPLVPTGGGSIVTVLAPSVAANSKIFLNYKTIGGTPGVLLVPDATIQPGVSFQIKSSSATDASTVTYTIITPTSGFIPNTASLAGGTVTVNNVNVLSGSTILLTDNTLGGTLGTYVRVSAQTPGTSFVITSQNAADISTVNYVILPAAYQTNVTTYPLGIFTPADDTPSTNTTGDVRGTYKPSSAANGFNVLHFSTFVSGFDNFIDQQAAATLPAGGTAAVPLSRSTTTVDDQVGISQYYTGIFA